MATRSQKKAPLCCVTIGFQDYLMPADKGLQVVGLMKEAIPCDKRYDDSLSYVVSSKPHELGMTIVRETQVHKEASNESAVS